MVTENVKSGGDRAYPQIGALGMSGIELIDRYYEDGGSDFSEDRRLHIPRLL
jgi:hypothetical protein